MKLEIDPEGVRNYGPLPASKGDLLFRAGRLAESRIQFEGAAALTRNEHEQAFLLRRAAACSGTTVSARDPALLLDKLPL